MQWVVEILPQLPRKVNLAPLHLTPKMELAQLLAPQSTMQRDKFLCMLNYVKLHASLAIQLGVLNCCGTVSSFSAAVFNSIIMAKAIRAWKWGFVCTPIVCSTLQFGLLSIKKSCLQFIREISALLERWDVSRFLPFWYHELSFEWGWKVAFPWGY